MYRVFVIAGISGFIHIKYMLLDYNLCMDIGLGITRRNHELYGVVCVQNSRITVQLYVSHHWLNLLAIQERLFMFNL